MHIIFMLQIVMWITILPLYHYALFIESNHDSYWFGFWDWETCSEANLNSYQTLRSAKHLFSLVSFLGGLSLHLNHLIA